MKKSRPDLPSAPKRARSSSGADEGDHRDDPSHGGRWSSRREKEVVLRRFRGESLDALSRELCVTETLASMPYDVASSLDALSRELGVTPSTLAESRNEALAGRQAGLRFRDPDHRVSFMNYRKAEVGDQAMQIDFLEKRIEILADGHRPPPRRSAP